MLKTHDPTASATQVLGQCHTIYLFIYLSIPLTHLFIPSFIHFEKNSTICEQSIKEMKLFFNRFQNFTKRWSTISWAWWYRPLLPNRGPWVSDLWVQGQSGLCTENLPQKTNKRTNKPTKGLLSTRVIYACILFWLQTIEKTPCSSRYIMAKATCEVIACCGMPAYIFQLNWSRNLDKNSEENLIANFNYSESLQIWKSDERQPKCRVSPEAI